MCDGAERSRRDFLPPIRPFFARFSLLYVNIR
jgi:hypothetical protein